MTFAVFILKNAQAVLHCLPEKDFMLCVSALKTLSNNPFPGQDGDKEKLKGYENTYRLHIGRTYTAIYSIDKQKKRVCVNAFGTIGDMHKIY